MTKKSPRPTRRGAEGPGIVWEEESGRWYADCSLSLGGAEPRKGGRGSGRKG